MGTSHTKTKNVQEVVQEVVVQEVVQVFVQVDQVDQVVAPLDALSVVWQAPDDEGVPGELRGHPRGGHVRPPAPQPRVWRLRRLRQRRRLRRLRQRRRLRLVCCPPGQLRLQL